MNEKSETCPQPSFGDSATELLSKFALGLRGAFVASSQSLESLGIGFEIGLVSLNLYSGQPGQLVTSENHDLFWARSSGQLKSQLVRAIHWLVSKGQFSWPASIKAGLVPPSTNVPTGSAGKGHSDPQRWVLSPESGQLPQNGHRPFNKANSNWTMVNWSLQ